MKKVHEGFRSTINYKKRPGDLRQSDIDKVVMMYEAGYKVNRIAIECHCHVDTVNNVARRLGLNKRKPGSGRWGKDR